MYVTRLLIRCCTVVSWNLSKDWNNGPQTGISAEPCAPGPFPNFRELATLLAGYFPSCFLASCVRSVGGTFMALAAGPLPLPSIPWQGAQYCVYISFPEAGLVCLIGACLTTGLSCAGHKLVVTTSIPSRIMLFFNMKDSFLVG